MHKHRLFIKIYLWFWLATIAVIITGVIVDRLTDPGPEMHFKHSFGNALLLFGQSSVDILEREGLASLKSRINRLDGSSSIQLFFFDDEGHGITEKKSSPEIEKIALLAKNSGRLETVFSSEARLAAQRISSRSGKNYVIVGKDTHPLTKPFLFPAFIPGLKPPPPPPGPPPGHGPHPGGPPPPSHEQPWSLALRLLAAIVVSGLVCYCLTRYLISPIIALGNATRQLAKGDLTVRVSPKIGKRKDEISSLAHDFDYMAERMESLLTAQRNLMRDVSHELRSPLARLNVALELCRQRCNPEAEKSLERITREAEKLNELIGQVLTLNRADAGISGLEKTKVDMVILIREITDDADFEAKSMNRAVKFQTEDDCLIMGNKYLLRSAIENVVRNALLYTKEETEVTVTLRQIQKYDRSYASITVRDHGTGVPPGEIENLFKPFYRVNEDLPDGRESSGIGLAITDAAVRLHGGSVRADNAPDGGLIIEMIFPSY